MTIKKPKLFIASKYHGRISHRKLNQFEEKNWSMFSSSMAAFDSWEEAHRWMVKNMANAVAESERKLANLKKQLARAKSMKAPKMGAGQMGAGR